MEGYSVNEKQWWRKNKGKSLGMFLWYSTPNLIFFRYSHAVGFSTLTEHGNGGQLDWPCKLQWIPQSIKAFKRNLSNHSCSIVNFSFSESSACSPNYSFNTQHPSQFLHTTLVSLFVGWCMLNCACRTRLLILHWSGEAAVLSLPWFLLLFCLWTTIRTQLYLITMVFWLFRTSWAYGWTLTAGVVREVKMDDCIYFSTVSVWISIDFGWSITF